MLLLSMWERCYSPSFLALHSLVNCQLQPCSCRVSVFLWSPHTCTDSTVRDCQHFVLPLLLSFFFLFASFWSSAVSTTGGGLINDVELDQSSLFPPGFLVQQIFCSKMNKKVIFRRPIICLCWFRAGVLMVSI